MPLELLEQLDALVSAALRVDEHDDWMDVRRGNRLDHKSAAVFLRLEHKTETNPQLASQFKRTIKRRRQNYRGKL